jgi:hypothetical protein
MDLADLYKTYNIDPDEYRQTEIKMLIRTGLEQVFDNNIAHMAAGSPLRWGPYVGENGDVFVHEGNFFMAAYSPAAKGPSLSDALELLEERLSDSEIEKMARSVLFHFPVEPAN